MTTERIVEAAAEVEAARDRLGLIITEARRDGMSDGQIGQILGVSKQAVQKRWPRKN